VLRSELSLDPPYRTYMCVCFSSPAGRTLIHYPQFDITINDQPAGHIVFRLFDDVVPKMAKNFRELTTGNTVMVTRGPRSTISFLIHAPGWQLYPR
jgi:hypothetical protein